MRVLGRPVTATKVANALPVVMLPPCFRCGARGDIGCKCRSGGIEWLAKIPRDAVERPDND